MSAEGGGGSGSGGGGNRNPPPPTKAPKPPELPLYGIILIVVAAVIIIVVVIVLIVYFRRRQIRRQGGDVEKNKVKHVKKENHGGKGHRHAKPNEKSKIVNSIPKGEGKKNIKEEKVVHHQSQPDKRAARDKSTPAAPQIKKSVRPAQPTPAPSDDAYIDMTQQSGKQAKPLPTYDNKPSHLNTKQSKPLQTYDNRPSNQNVYDELEPENSYEGLQSEYLKPTPQGGDMYQSLENSDSKDYVNVDNGSYLELEAPGYEDPVPSAQLTAHYSTMK